VHIFTNVNLQNTGGQFRTKQVSNILLARHRVQHNAKA
jgi:hypothetical protein